MEVGGPFLAQSGADNDAKLAFAVEAQVPQRAGVWSPSDRLQFIDDFHRSKFRRTGNASAGKTRGESGEMGCPRPQAAFDGRDQVLDLGVTLEPNELRDLHGPELADFAKVVAQQVGYHHQFR